MPYGLGFSQSDINARCRRQFDKRDSTQGKRPKKSLKLAGLKVLKQKSALNELQHHLEKESEQNRNDKDIECPFTAATRNCRISKPFGDGDKNIRR